MTKTNHIKIAQKVTAILLEAGIDYTVKHEDGQVIFCAGECFYFTIERVAVAYVKAIVKKLKPK